MAGLDRTRPPSPAAPAALRLRDAHRRTLSNGLESLVVPKPELPVVDVLLVLRAGGVEDPRGQEGLAAFAAEMVDEGTARRLFEGSVLYRAG